LDPATLIALIIAIYGAIFSTITYVRQERAKKEEKKPRIRVKIGFGVAIIWTKPQKAITLEAQNWGSTKVTFRSIPQLLLPDETKLVGIMGVWIGDTVPRTLEPGDSLTMSILISKLVEALKKEGYSEKITMIGEFTDALDNEYKSNPLDFDIDVWGKE
jgi:hypothetical protein